MFRPLQMLPIVVALAALLVLALLWPSSHRPARRCLAAPMLGPGMVVCADGLIYHRQEGGLAYVGPLGFPPPVPRG